MTGEKTSLHNDRTTVPIRIRVGMEEYGDNICYEAGFVKNT